jgi:DNA-binding MarR family transcriptional regulator
MPVRLLADAKLSPWAKVVYGVLDAAADRSRVAMLSQRQIAEMAGTHQPMAARSLDVLQRFGWITVVDGARNRAKAYRVKR